MAFADPQSVTINAVAQSLPRVPAGVGAGRFLKEDGNVELTIRHSASAKRARHNIRLLQRKIAADPLATGINFEASASVSLTVDCPRSGFTNTEIKYIVDALTAYLTASSGAKVTQLLGNEA